MIISTYLLKNLVTFRCCFDIIKFMSEKKSMLDGDRQYHIQLKEGDVADFIILPGDPGRVDFIAEHFDDAKEVAYNREYKTITGTYKGRPVSVTSTGIGCPSAAIAVEELANIGAKTLVRLGTSGAMQEHTRVGDFQLRRFVDIVNSDLSKDIVMLLKNYYKQTNDLCYLTP